MSCSSGEHGIDLDRRETVDKQPGACPTLTLRITVETKSDWKTNYNAMLARTRWKDKDRKKPRYTLTIFAIRSDGEVFDSRSVRCVLMRAVL